MIGRVLQIFLAALLLAVAHGAPSEIKSGNVYDISLHDVDGNDLSTTAGAVTIITVVTRDNEEKARAIAALVPERCIGDPRYRYITLVNFRGRIPRPLRGLTRAVIRSRLDAEAIELKPRFVANQSDRDPRKDIYVVADFDGAAVEKLGLAAVSEEIAVFVFNGRGRLVARWDDVPPGDALPKAIAAAE